MLALLGLPRDLPEGRIVVDDRHVGPGYGLPTPAMLDALRTLACTEGLLLDPVYTGKAMAGMLARLGEGLFGDDEDVVFVHTGGAQALFGYRDVLTQETQAQGIEG